MVIIGRDVLESKKNQYWDSCSFILKLLDLGVKNLVSLICGFLIYKMGLIIVFISSDCYEN
jgi:hypothetical protein